MILQLSPLISLYACNCFSLIEQVKKSGNVATADKFSQVSIETVNAGVQTDDIILSDADYNKFINNMAELNLTSQQEFLSQYAQMTGADFKLNKPSDGSLSCAQVPVSYGTQQMDPYLAAQAQMWSSIGQYPDYATNLYVLQAPATSAPSNMPVSDAIASQAGVLFNHDVPDVSHVSRAMASSRVLPQDTTQLQKMPSPLPSPKDIVDEREDLAIEQSLKDFENMEMESQHSYASALNCGE